MNLVGEYYTMPVGIVNPDRPVRVPFAIFSTAANVYGCVEMRRWMQLGPAVTLLSVWSPGYHITSSEWMTLHHAAIYGAQFAVYNYDNGAGVAVIDNGAGLVVKMVADNFECELPINEGADFLAAAANIALSIEMSV